jgi:hypothetical protein
MKASEPAGNGHSGATEDALRLAVDTTPSFIHTGRPDGYLDYFNRGWLDLIGHSLLPREGRIATDTAANKDLNK